ncbi:hypothetical protein AN401_11620 [Zobellella denitrificans]|uniref:Uncharacterized protein n=1 Tax=Zobellella denitrificans TaxID=347534 RepID=A0A291HQ39_9GAMM|nr:hypothetical protein [Zobellella denitrificans]ATG74336.1 hypothetical protein AN401_11115 [Zobellella denitrificans]ATG74421.1 hypothetical protein AN401_11620 [Zobellella denitrificans]
MAITKAQWEAVRAELWDSFSGSVEFVYQGHRISCQARLDHKRKLVIRVYLNGTIKGAWLLAVREPEKHPCSDPEVALVPLFWSVKRSALYSRKEQERLTKGFGKRQVKRLFPNLDAAVEMPTDTWGSATRMIAQFKRVEGLELVRIGYRNMAEVAGE